MKRLKLWWVAAAFYAVCCVLNLIGCISSGDLERCVKPALMPLLCLTTVAYLLESAAEGLRDRETCHPRQRKREGPTKWEGSRSDSPGPGAPLLLILGQLFGFAGDTMLMGKGFPFFAAGIGLFLIGHIFYISLFGGQSWKGLKPWQWILAIVCCLGIVTGLIFCIGVNGVLLIPMGVYGFALTLLLFSTLAGAVRFGGLTWWLLFAGAVLFSCSDALLAVRHFGTHTPFTSSVVIMSTYLAAQTLLAIGGVRLIKDK